MAAGMGDGLTKLTDSSPRSDLEARARSGHATERTGAMADNERADGHASAAAQEAGAVDQVERNTKTQTTAASYTTTDHDVIRSWAEARGAVPASVGQTGNGADGDSDAGILRLEFRDSADLEEVDWDAFFRTFDDRGLAFVYQEKTSDGTISRFNKFVRR